MSLKQALAECVAWVRKHNATFVIDSDGGAAIYQEGDEEELAYVEVFEPSEELIRALLVDAEETLDVLAAPPPLAPPVVAADVTWFGLGLNEFAWGERRTITLTPEQALNPQRMVVPSSAFGYVVYQMRFAGQPLLVNAAGVPVELFSEVSTAPQLRFPTVGPASPIEIEIQAPPMPKAPSPFTGLLYGTVLEKKR